jgi:ATP-dependent protease ClpP protease subunit
MDVVWRIPPNVSKFKLHADPTSILIGTEIDEDTVTDVAQKLSVAACTGQPFVYCYISSPGGDCHACIAIVNLIKGSPIPVHTVILSHASSAAAVIFSCGTKRFLGPGASLMIHDVSIGGSAYSSTKSADFLVEANQTKKLQKSLFRIMAENIGLSDRDYFIKLIKSKNNVDVYLTAQKMRELKIVTDEGIPYMEATVRIKYHERVKKPAGASKPRCVTPPPISESEIIETPRGLKRKKKTAK